MKIFGRERCAPLSPYPNAEFYGADVMKILLYGGSFNPPHPAHIRAAAEAAGIIKPDKLIIMPAADPPHKSLAPYSPPPAERLILTRLAFSGLKEAEVSDMEIMREGESYTVDTLRELSSMYPGSEIIFLMGSDMLLSFERWHDWKGILENASLAVLSREKGDREELEACACRIAEENGVEVRVLPVSPVPMSSSDMRAMLSERKGAGILDPRVYARIIKTRPYRAKPQLSWLREKAYAYLDPRRIPHVKGCEEEAVRLAGRWGASPGDAAECAILHDITKKLGMEEQLLLCGKYAIIIDNLERGNIKLLHAKTGAELAKDLFGSPQEIYDAIRWHTTGRPGMSLLEKVMYMADYIEPSRNFSGVEPLRKLAYENLDAAMVLGLEMSLAELESAGKEPHRATVDALEFFRKAV